MPWLTVAGVALFTYVTALPNGFVSDVGYLIPGNPSLLNSHEWLPWFSRSYFWGTNIRGQVLYRPLTILSYLVTIRLGGAEPFLFMVGNVVLHGGASLLVLAMGRYLVGARAGLLGALLFAVHPLHTEAVAWIGGRTDLLATVFALASALCFLRATEENARRPAVYALCAATGYLAALLSKESAILLPAWFALVWFLERRQRSLRWAVVALAGCLVAVLAYVILKAGVEAPLSRSVAFLAARSVESVWVPSRWFAGLAIAGKYSALFLWPSGLTFDYSAYTVGLARSGWVPGLEVLWGGVVVVGFLAALIRAIRAHRGLALALAFIPITYAVVSAFPLTPQFYVAERFTYLPSVGACLAAAWLLLRVIEKASWAQRGSERLLRRASEVMSDPKDSLIPPWMRAGWRGPVAFGLLLSLLTALAVQSAVRNVDWRTNEAVASAALAVSPDSPLALRGLGYVEYSRGNYQAARALFEKSMRLNPTTWEPFVALAQLYLRDGETERAIEISRRAVAQFPRRPELTHNLAALLLQGGRGEEAESLFRQIIAREPNFFLSRLGLGRILLDTGRASEALEHFRVVSALKPESALGWFGMARASLALGRMTEARVYADKAKGAGMTLPEELSRALERGAP